MKINKKFFLLLLCTSAFSQSTVAAEGHDSNYTFFSAGLAMDSNGFVSSYAPVVKKIDLNGGKTVKAGDHDSLNASSMGGYLNGSYGFDNNIFLEARLRYLSNRQNGFSTGVGYRFPMDDCSSLYMLAGVSKPDLPEAIKLAVDEHNKITINFQGSMGPTIGAGYRLHLNDDMGLRFAARLGLSSFEIAKYVLKSDNDVSDSKSKERSKIIWFNSEYSVGAHYRFTPQLAVEANYTFSKVLLGSHRGTVGLRYAF